jgi:hypothetical protein
MKVAPMDQMNFLDFEPEINPFKVRFSNDVLPLIEKGLRLAGIEPNGTVCCICYSTNQCIIDHAKYEMVSYERIIAEGNHFLLALIPVPYDAFKYIFRAQAQSYAVYLWHHCVVLNTDIPLYTVQTASI